MPYDITTVTLPCGARCVRADGSGVISKADADYIMTFIGQNGSMFGEPLLVLTQKIKSFSAEAMKLFGGGLGSSEKQAWVGVVAPNPLIRVATNFMVRVSGHRKVKLFGTEEEAIRWLDERVRGDALKAKAT